MKVIEALNSIPESYLVKNEDLSLLSPDETKECENWIKNYFLRDCESCRAKLKSAKETPFFDQDAVDGWENWIEEHDRHVKELERSRLLVIFELYIAEEVQDPIKFNKIMDKIREKVAN